MISGICGQWGGWVKGLVLWMAGAAVVFAASDVANHRDTLAYKDGDRVQGTLVQNAGGTIVFKSDRFGELRVPSADAVVIKAEKSSAAAATTAAAKPPVPPSTPGTTTPKPEASDGAAKPAAVAKAQPKPEPAKTAEEQAEEDKVTIWDRFSPSVLTARVRNFFGPWHGRVAASTDVVTDSTERSTLALEGTLRRKWERDEVQLTARYDYAETTDIPTTDMVKGSGSWRHEFTKKHFGHYRPSVEWNRVSRVRNVDNEYLLVQQELGVGSHLLTTPARKIRIGVSQNLFQIWNTAEIAPDTSRGVQSAFEEVELKLPWQMGLTQRGVWYPVNGQVDGWENRIELNKKLTETLSTSVRHEIRRNNPDGSAQDYTRLKVLFGLDF